MPVPVIEPSAWLLGRVFLCLLILLRTIGLFSLLPVPGRKEIPRQVYYLGAFILTAFILSIYWDTSIALPENILEGSVLLGLEFLYGLFLSVILLLFFSCLAMAGDIISRMSGFSIAVSFDSSMEDTTPVLAQLFMITGIVVFLTAGGLESFLTGYLDSFGKLPPGSNLTIQNGWETTLRLLNLSTFLAVRMATPVILASLTVFLTAGILGKAVPQLNVMLISFNTSTLLVLAVIMGSLGASFRYFENEILTIIKLVFMQHDI